LCRRTSARLLHGNFIHESLFCRRTFGWFLADGRGFQRRSNRACVAWLCLVCCLMLASKETPFLHSSRCNCCVCLSGSESPGERDPVTWCRPKRCWLRPPLSFAECASIHCGLVVNLKALAAFICRPCLLSARRTVKDTRIPSGTTFAYSRVRPEGMIFILACMGFFPNREKGAALLHTVSWRSMPFASPSSTV